MGAGFSRRRYMGGKRLEKFYKDDILPTIKNILLSLHIQESHCFQIFKVFAIIDENENGLCDQGECNRYFGGKRTRFTDRVFFCEIIEEMTDENRDNLEGYKVGGKLIRTGYNFKEFLIVVWSFCTLNTANMARYVFEIFDPDDIQILYKKHVCAMFKMLYDEDMVDEEYINLFEFNSAEQITKYSFIERCCHRTEFLQPAFAYQSVLRKKLGGVIIWELLTQARSRYLLIYDDQNRFLSEAVEDIIKTKLEMLEAKQILKTSEGILQDSSSRLDQSIETSRKELKNRVRQVKNEQKALQEVSRDKYMRDAWQTFFDKRRQFSEEEFSTAVKDVMRRKEMRDEVYHALEQAVVLSDEYFLWKDDHDLNFAIGTDGDHQARYEDFLKLNEGQWLNQLTYLLHLFKILQEQCVKKYGTSSAVSDLYAQKNKNKDKGKGKDEADKKADGSGTPRRRKSLMAAFGLQSSWRSNNSSSKIAAASSDEEDLEVSLRRAANNARGLKKNNADDNSMNSGSNNKKGKRASRRDKEVNEKPRKQVAIEAALIEVQKFRAQLVDFMDQVPFQLSPYDNLVLANNQEGDGEEDDAVLFGSAQSNTPVQAILKKAQQQQQGSSASKKIKAPGDDDNKVSEENKSSGNNNKGASILTGIYETPAQKKEKFLAYLQNRSLAEELNTAKKYATTTDIALAERQATIQMKEELKARTIDSTRKMIAQQQKERQKEYKRKEFYISTTFGSKITKWEYVFERDRNRYFYVNRESLEVRHPKTAFCEFCDAIFVQHELRCGQCDKPRSTKNLKFYRPLGFKDITDTFD